MSMSDPIADMLTRIRNAGKAGQQSVSMPFSKEKLAIAELLKENGYVNDCSVQGEAKKELTIDLKYYSGKFVVEGLQRISKPSRRVYVGVREIPRVLGGFGIAVLSTPQGIMTGKTARQKNLGGEVLCHVW